MKRFACAVILSCGLIHPAIAAELKSTRIALFSSGVGYFESAASVEGNASADLTFRVDQVNDILKSLVLRDLDGGSIAAVQYPSRDPIDKTLKSFGVDITGKPTLASLLDQIRGVKVEVQAATPVVGSVFGVEVRRTVTPHGTIVDRDVLNILTDGGLRSFELDQIAGVRIQDAKVEAELTKALATLALAHDADKKSVTLNFSGQGKRRVMASYILETPIWKTSYRLQMTKTKKPYLQGWAIVENATEQDWENVNLSLVSGRPISFKMDLYQPLYIPRPVEQLALYGSLRSPEYEGNMVADMPKIAAAASAALKRKSRAAFGQPGLQEGGLSGGRIITEGKDEDVSTDGIVDAENMLRPIRSGVASVASAQSAGELFEYTIAAPVSLKRQQSAMLPIVTEEVEGEKLSVFNPATHPKNPLNSLKLKNSTKLFLMQGPVTVFDGGVYAGDAKLPDLRAAEDRMIAYALDLAAEVNVEHASVPDEVTQLRIAKGTIILQRKYVDERTYVVKNKGEAAKAVVLEQETGDDWKLIEPKEPYEKTAKLTRFKIDVPAGETKRLKVRMDNVRSEQIVLSNTGPDQIELYLKMRVVSEAVRKALKKVIELRAAVADTGRDIALVDSEINSITSEQARIRENMKVLTQTSDVYRRYEKKFGEQETRIEALREKLAALRDTERRQTQALEEFMLSLNVE